MFLRTGRFPSEVLAEFDSHELTELQLVDLRLDPQGPARLETMLGQLAALMYNVNRGKRQRAVRPSEFIPDYLAEPKPSKSREDMDKTFAAIAARWNRNRKGA